MADKYIYAVARIRALEMSLMSQAAIEQLVATDSYKKAVQFIIEKGWGDSDNASMDENDILRAETDKTWAAVAEMVNDMSVFDVICITISRRRSRLWLPGKLLPMCSSTIPR